MPDASMPPSEFASANLLLSAIVDSSDDAIISKDLNGIVTSWNPAAARIFGFDEAEMIGRPITMLIPADRQSEESVILERLRRGERVDHFDTQRVAKDGSTVDVSLTISPIRNVAGIIVGASKIARDITARKRWEAALKAHQVQLKKATEEAQAAREEAERQSRMKDEFLATLSHELRTPLQSILGWTDVLLSGGCAEDEITQGLDVIDRNAKSQARIIEDLLDMSSILSGKVRLNVQRVSLVPLIEAALEAVKPAARAKGIQLQAVLDPQAQPVSGDPNRLQQIFWNLLSNAIKFTPRGGRVQVVLERIHSHLEVSVADSGMGISPDFLPHVFERFRQADPSITRSHGGLGLGLAIVKNLAELHGGSVKVESPGFSMGATFTVHLPLTVLHPDPPSEAGRHPGEAGRRDMTHQVPRLDGVSIVVVDDEEDARILLSVLLSKAGASVRAAGSAREGLDLVSTAAPDVLISDIGMPGEDGFALIRAVRTLPVAQGGRVPAIALTAYTRTEDRVKAIADGFQMHLSKPADGVELVTMISSLVKHSARRVTAAGVE